MEQLDKVHDKLDKIIENQAKHSVYIEKNTEDLAEHIKRTNLLEKKIERTEEKIEAKIDNVEKEVHTIKVTYKTVLWILSAIVALLGFIKLVIEVFK